MTAQNDLYPDILSVKLVQTIKKKNLDRIFYGIVL